ncbi:MAG: DUF167 domain-containing protein [Planctomycetaceae bacterium]
MLEWKQDGDDVLLLVQAQPGSRKNGITGIHAGRLKVAVTAAPEKGKANKALEKVLANLLGFKRSQVSLENGATSTHKTIRFADVTVAMLRERLSEHVDFAH